MCIKILNMSTSTLPKPFKPENVTNSNANEKITNYFLKNSVTMDYDGNKSKNINYGVDYSDWDFKKIRYFKYVDGEIRDMSYKINDPNVNCFYNFFTNNIGIKLFLCHLISF